MRLSDHYPQKRAFVTGADLGDETVDGDPIAVRKLALERDHVVELKELALGDGDPKLERGRVLGPDDPSGDCRHSWDGSIPLTNVSYYDIS